MSNFLCVMRREKSTRCGCDPRVARRTQMTVFQDATVGIKLYPALGFTWLPNEFHLGFNCASGFSWVSNDLRALLVLQMDSGFYSGVKWVLGFTLVSNRFGIYWASHGFWDLLQLQLSFHFTI